MEIQRPGGITPATDIGAANKGTETQTTGESVKGMIGNTPVTISVVGAKNMKVQVASSAEGNIEISFSKKSLKERAITKLSKTKSLLKPVKAAATLTKKIGGKAIHAGAEKLKSAGSFAKNKAMSGGSFAKSKVMSGGSFIKGAAAATKKGFVKWNENKKENTLNALKETKSAITGGAKKIKDYTISKVKTGGAKLKARLPHKTHGYDRSDFEKPAKPIKERKCSSVESVSFKSLPDSPPLPENASKTD
ncbi:MAG: hypothetical protein OXC48_02440 [Endozoicomonadaceae bacterium]|nr:hypothetical protein [Endozoicomonadaceae bacterium]